MFLKNKKRFLHIFIISLLAILDLYSKQQVVKFFYNYNNNFYFINNFFNISFVKNTGVSFGILNNIHNGRFILSFLTFLIIIYITTLYSKKEFSYINKQLCLSFVISGALGNTLDRIYNSYVIDFLDIHYYNYHWPSFNLADIYICIGVFCLILIDFFKKH